MVQILNQISQKGPSDLLCVNVYFFYFSFPFFSRKPAILDITIFAFILEYLGGLESSCLGAGGWVCMWGVRVL